MITPFFTVSQDEEFLHVSIKVSHIRFSANAIEMVIDSEVFIFSLAPYYLRLRFPYALVDDERATASFDLASGSVNVQLPKEVKGQDFPDLDLSAKLLARTNDSAIKEPSKPLIEELDVSNKILEHSEMASEAQAHDWEIEQEVAPENPLNANQYGFNNAYSRIVGVSTTNGNDINELGDPELPLPNDRIIERLVKENIKFDPEYYAADYIMEKYPSPDDDKIYAGIMLWKNPATRKFIAWYKSQQQLPESSREALMPVEFSKEEQEKMQQLPKRSYLLEDSYKPQLWVLIISMLFAHQYDLRENEGEHNIESAWTIGKLTPQFSFLDSQLHIRSESSTSILKAGIITGIRRALSYPYHRHYKVALKAWDDVYYVLRGGKRMVLKCLLDLKELFRFHDVYYVYDKIWLEDLCSWILNDVSEGSIRELAHDLKRELGKITKEDITFEKVDDSQSGDAMMAIDVGEVEALAEESYDAYNAH